MAVRRQSDGSDSQTGSLWGLPIRLKELKTFSCFPLSQHRGFYMRRSLSLQRGKYVISFCFPLFKQSGINYPPTSSVPLSFKKGASFLMLSFNQLSHACLLQEENIPLHTVPNSIGICRQQTKFATFTLSLQNGKSSLFRSFMQLWNSYFYTRH